MSHTLFQIRSKNLWKDGLLEIFNELYTGEYNSQMELFLQIQNRS